MAYFRGVCRGGPHHGRSFALDRDFLKIARMAPIGPAPNNTDAVNPSPVLIDFYVFKEDVGWLYQEPLNV